MKLREGSLTALTCNVVAGGAETLPGHGGELPGAPGQPQDDGVLHGPHHGNLQLRQALGPHTGGVHYHYHYMSI